MNQEQFLGTLILTSTANKWQEFGHFYIIPIYNEYLMLNEDLQWKQKESINKGVIFSC